MDRGIGPHTREQQADRVVYHSAMRERIVNMLIDLEAIRAMLSQQVAEELKATVRCTIHSQRQNGPLFEVTFDLWIERLGTCINRHMFLVLNPDALDLGQFRSVVKRFIKSELRRELVAQQSKDFRSKAEQN